MVPFVSPARLSGLLLYLTAPFTTLFPAACNIGVSRQEPLYVE